MRPVLDDVLEAGATRRATFADQRHRDVGLVEGLVPDLVEPVGRRDARADAGIHEVEEEEARDALGRRTRHRLHDRAAHVVTDQADPLGPESVEDREQVLRMVRCAVRTAWLVAVAEAAQVGAIMRRPGARRSITGRHVGQNSGRPWIGISGLPRPVATTWKRAPFASRSRCSIRIAVIRPWGASTRRSSSPAAIIASPPKGRSRFAYSARRAASRNRRRLDRVCTRCGHAGRDVCRNGTRRSH